MTKSRIFVIASVLFFAMFIAGFTATVLNQKREIYQGFNIRNSYVDVSPNDLRILLVCDGEIAAVLSPDDNEVRPGQSILSEAVASEYYGINGWTVHPLAAFFAGSTVALEAKDFFGAVSKAGNRVQALRQIVVVSLSAVSGYGAGQIIARHTTHSCAKAYKYFNEEAGNVERIVAFAFISKKRFLDDVPDFSLEHDFTSEEIRNVLVDNHHARGFRVGTGHGKFSVSEVLDRNGKTPFYQFQLTVIGIGILLFLLFLVTLANWSKKWAESKK